MSLVTGANGALHFRGVRVAKVRNFSLDVSRDALEDTALGDEDRTYIEGLRGATGSATILYVDDDATTREMLNSIFSSDGAASIELYLNTSTQRSLSCSAFLTQVGTPVSVGEITACSCSFQVSGKVGGGF